MESQTNNSKENRKNGNENKRIIDSNKVVKECPICLAVVSNRSLTDTCLHEYCFECLKEWSVNHNRCPVCRSIYRYIVFNILSEEVFERLPVEEQLDRNEDENQEIDSFLSRIVL